MTAREESFLVLEKSLTNRISRQWEDDINGTLNEIVRLVNAGRFQEAEALCDELSMRNVAEKNKRYMEFVGMQAVLFGASRLTQGHVSRTMFMQDDAEVPEEVAVASQALSDGLSTEGSEDVCAQARKLIAEEKVAQEEAAFSDDGASTGDVPDIEDTRTKAERRKAATDTFIRRFRSSVKGNGEAYINITGSLHTSRLGGWGFLQEAKFRGITEYQVSEQLDSRTCPVCRTMHGRKFLVGPADNKLQNWLSVDNLQQMKSIAPWPKQSKSAIAELASMSQGDIANRGWDTPPYHPLCRGILVENGTIAEKLPVPRDRVVGPSEQPIPVTAPDELIVTDPHEIPFTGSVAEYRDRFFVSNVDADDVLARHNPNAATIIDGYERDLKKRVSTHETWQDAAGNWLPERAALHQEIIDTVLSDDVVARAKAAPGTQPKMVILGGRGGSGKTFLTEGIDEDFFKANGYGKGAPVDIRDKVVLNSDDIKKLLPEYEGWNAGQVHVEGSYLLKQIEKIARQRRINVVLDTTMAGVDKARGTVLNYINAGYEVEGYYMHLPRQEAAFRAVFRGIGGERRYVPINIILKNLDNEEAFDALKTLFTRWGVWDNQVELGQLPRFVGAQNLPAGVGPPGGG